MVYCKGWVRVSSVHSGSSCKGWLSGMRKTWGESAKKLSFLPSIALKTVAQISHLQALIHNPFNMCDHGAVFLVACRISRARVSGGLISMQGGTHKMRQIKLNVIQIDRSKKVVITVSTVKSIRKLSHFLTKSVFGCCCFFFETITFTTWSSRVVQKCLLLTHWSEGTRTFNRPKIPFIYIEHF